MQKHFKKLLIMLLLAALLVSCGGEAPVPTEEVEALMTSVVSTMVASFFETQTALVTPVTSTSISTETPFATVTQFPSSTPFALSTSTFIYFTATLGSLTPGSPTVTGTLPTATVNPGALAVGCNNLGFIRDVTIPAGTVIQPNKNFTKTWKVQNTGTCNWMYQYSFMLLSGDSYGEDKVIKIQKLVTVNDWTELSVSMTAPKKPGTYTSYWRLADLNQTMFGATLAVSFVVPGPTSAPTITKTPAPTSTFTVAPPPTSTFTVTPPPSETPTLTPTP